MLFDYGLETESQLFALDLTPLEKKRKRGGKDKYDTENELRLKVIELQKEIQKLFEEAVYNNVAELEEEEEEEGENQLGAPKREGGDELEQGRLKLASAIYFVTYYSDTVKNKEQVLHLARLLSEKEESELDAFIVRKKEESEKKRMLEKRFRE